MSNPMKILTTTVVAVIFIIYGLPPLLGAIASIIRVLVGGITEIIFMITNLLPATLKIAAVVLLGLSAIGMAIEIVRLNNVRDVLVNAPPAAYSYLGAGTAQGRIGDK